jgi:hypothetical protein
VRIQGVGAEGSDAGKTTKNKPPDTRTNTFLTRFLMRLARLAYRSVLIVSAALKKDGETQAHMSAMPVPPLHQ